MPYANKVPTDNYIYIYQLSKYVLIPTRPDQIQDSLGSNFSSTNVLSRTAPIQSYTGSGPRSSQINLNLHRDEMQALNYGNATFLDSSGVELNDDYIDTLIKYLQAMALPSYKHNSDTSIALSAMLNPPLVAVQFGQQFFMKGVVNGEVGVTYSGAIGRDGKYKQVAIMFKVTEIEPQEATTIAQNGSMRPLSTTLSRGLYGSGKNWT